MTFVRFSSAQQQPRGRSAIGAVGGGGVTRTGSGSGGGSSYQTRSNLMRNITTYSRLLINYLELYFPGGRSFNHNNSLNHDAEFFLRLIIDFW